MARRRSRRSRSRKLRRRRRSRRSRRSRKRSFNSEHKKRMTKMHSQHKSRMRSLKRHGKSIGIGLGSGLAGLGVGLVSGMALGANHPKVNSSFRDLHAKTKQHMAKIKEDVESLHSKLFRKDGTARALPPGGVTGLTNELI